MLTFMHFFTRGYANDHRWECIIHFQAMMCALYFDCHDLYFYLGNSSDAQLVFKET